MPKILCRHFALCAFVAIGVTACGGPIPQDDCNPITGSQPAPPLAQIGNFTTR